MCTVGNDVRECRSIVGSSAFVENGPLLPRNEALDGRYSSSTVMEFHR